MRSSRRAPFARDDAAGSGRSVCGVSRRRTERIELRSFLDLEFPEWLAQLDPVIAPAVRDAENLSAREYLARVARLASLARRAAPRLDGVDVIASPTLCLTPPLLSEVADAESHLRVNRRIVRNTVAVNYLGLCAITMPVGRDSAGMPVGLQLTAPAGAEEKLLDRSRSLRNGCSAPPPSGSGPRRCSPPDGAGRVPLRWIIPPRSGAARFSRGRASRRRCRAGSARAPPRRSRASASAFRVQSHAELGAVGAADDALGAVQAHGRLDRARAERVAIDVHLRLAEARRRQLLLRRVEQAAVVHALDLVGNVAAQIVDDDRHVRVGREDSR